MILFGNKGQAAAKRGAGNFAVRDASDDEPRLTWPPHELQPRVAEGQLVSKLGYEFRWTADHKPGAEQAGAPGGPGHSSQPKRS